MIKCDYCGTHSTGKNCCNCGAGRADITPVKLPRAPKGCPSKFLPERPWAVGTKVLDQQGHEWIAVGPMQLKRPTSKLTYNEMLEMMGHRDSPSAVRSLALWGAGILYPESM